MQNKLGIFGNALWPHKFCLKPVLNRFFSPFLTVAIIRILLEIKMLEQQDYQNQF
jgi:hypothetical protein